MKKILFVMLFVASISQESLKDSDAFKRIKEGIKKDNKVKMEPEPNLSDEQVKELIIYVRSLKEKWFIAG